jgi:hypothetical protein
MKMKMKESINEICRHQAGGNERRKRLQQHIARKAWSRASVAA